MKMKTQNILIAHPTTDEQVAALKAIFKALKIKFELAKETPYDKDFVAKIDKSRDQIKKGQVTRIEKEELKKLLSL